MYLPTDTFNMTEHSIMRGLDIFRFALGSCATAAMLAGCGGAQPPIATLGAMQQSRENAPQFLRGSWMLPEAKGRDLLYVTGQPSDGGDSLVYVYSYPHGKRLGILGGFVRLPGACVDKAGDVFFVDSYYYATDEYQHGGTTRIATIYTPLLLPTSCSVDPTTGKLAISGISYTKKSPQGGVVISAYNQKRGWGLGKTYNDAAMAGGSYCAYDESGNLYLDGYSTGAVFHLGVLPKGGSTFAAVTLNQNISGAGRLQWNDNDLAIGDSGVSPSVIYQFSISGSSGTEVGSTSLSNGGVDSFWIQGKKIITSYYPEGKGKGKVGIWSYPTGGKVNRTLLVHLSSAATVSSAK